MPAARHQQVKALAAHMRRLVEVAHHKDGPIPGQRGFQRILVPEGNLKGLEDRKADIEIVPVARVEHALRQLFG